MILACDKTVCFIENNCKLKITRLQIEEFISKMSHILPLLRKMQMKVQILKEIQAV
jgi:hypothetical protein